MTDHRPTRLARRVLIGGSVAGLAFGLAACEPAASPTSPPASPPMPGTRVGQSTSPTPSVPPLTSPGVTEKAIAALRETAGNYPVIKVEVSPEVITLSVVRDNQAVTYAYRDGEVDRVDSSTEYYGQASFDPDDFDLSDVDALFSRAAAISGSDDNQELQIVEYNDSQVLMTVTTRPESMTVFLRRDGSPINRLDFTTEAGVAEALADTLSGATQVQAIGYSTEAGLWVDVPGVQGTIVRHTRPALLPVWTSTRKDGSELGLFSPTEVDARELAGLIARAPTMADADAGAPVSLSIDRRHGRSRPTIDWTVGGKHFVTNLDGVDITSQVR